MKIRAIIIILAVNLISFSNLFAEEPENPQKKEFLQTVGSLFDSQRHSLDLYSPDSLCSSINILTPESNTAFYIKNNSQKRGECRAPFRLGTNNPGFFSFKTPLEKELTQKNRKRYFRAAVEMTSLNVTIWLFNRYVIKEKWAYVSWDSWRNNLKSGFSWDKDTYWTNLLGHPYHGAINYTAARRNNLSVLESTLYTFFGSATWELFLESRGDKDNPPSRNDLMLNTLGGLALGEILFKAANLFIDESAVGFERVLRETMAFVVNPGNIFRVVSGDAFKAGLPPEKHYFNLKFPFGAYKTSSGQPTFLMALGLEYTDYLKGDTSSVHSYDWFSFSIKLGLQDYKLLDTEILTTGILAGRKIKGGIAGLFGVFDYMDTQTSKIMSALGLGPGLVTISESDSRYYFNSSGILYLILGGSSPSIESPDAHFGTKIDDPYYFGPGLLGRVRFELGKRGLGSIDTGFSQYWVHSIYTSVNEFLGILTLNLNCDISKRSQVSVGYDYYLRHASLEDERVKSTKPAVRAMYVLKF
ncbi:MAG: DUF3943 domain-containing protein [Candidatus Aminicenantes bacterium]|jgi:hypothetical protein